jgi:putative acetyltransferase
MAGIQRPACLRVVPYDPMRHGDAPWRIVAAVFEEYGFEFAVNDYDADLMAPHEHYDGRTGWFAVAEDEAGRVLGCVGLTDEGGGLFELHRLYVSKDARRSGAGSALTHWVIESARANGARRIILFSDVHFLDAHRLYRRMGFRNHRFRYAPDPWQSREWGFELTITSP